MVARILPSIYPEFVPLSRHMVYDTHHYTGDVRRRSRSAAFVEVVQEVQHQDNVVHSWYDRCCA